MRFSREYPSQKKAPSRRRYPDLSRRARAASGRRFLFTGGRVLRGALCLLLALSVLLPLWAVPEAEAVPYEEVYADSMTALNNWGVINGYADGELHPERYVTRAQFVAMVNRAYGYDQTGSHPFKDVPEDAWYADDIAIAYNMGYFTGTSSNTASPDTNLSRQQAMTLLAKNMRLDAIPGEVTEFYDGYAFAPYSRGYVKAAVRQGIINGYPDHTFRPEEPVTRGAMALMLHRALGHLISEPGTYEMGDVFGNVTIASPNTTLRNTTVAGDLYVTGGLGLGAVTLENVKTLGNIVVAGTGESEEGQDSVILRNVEAPKLTVDSINDQYLSVRSEGLTDIAETSFRTSAYLQDRTPSGEGLKAISLDGDNNTYTLSGNVETVTNRSANSALTVAAGSVQSLTMDEEGTGAKLSIENNGSVKALNLDTATSVSGGGGVGSATVNTAGSSTEMLPDTVDIRPGVTARINGDTLDTAGAQEAAEDPRLLTGYPRMSNVAPTNAVVLFSANKPGTVYWAVSSMGDGSISEEGLYNTAAYGSRAVASGRSTISASNTEVRANITALTSGLGYYLSAVLEDSRGARSPVKVISFTTPDGQVPAFVGSPSVSANDYKGSGRDTVYHTQIMGVTNKSCNMYWALYRGGSAAPTPLAFRGESLPGSLQHGIVECTQSLPAFLEINDLEEKSTYDVYLWLTDPDFANSSTVRKITFTTVDGTPPVLTKPVVTNTRATSITLTAVVDEDATIYWAAVRAGTEYPKPESGKTTYTPEYARIQIASGMNAEKSGSVKAKAGTNATINCNGLQAQTAYDIWFIAVDTAGNYSDFPYENPQELCMVSANTLDEVAPTVTMEFTRFPEDNAATPYANTDIRLVFSESVQRASTSQNLLDLYNAVVNAATNAERSVARDALAEALRNTVVFYDVSGGGQPQPAQERNTDNENRVEDWVIDYRNAVVTQEDNQIIVTYPTTDDVGRTSALHLRSGSTYYFQIEDIADTSTSRNRMPVTRTDRFRTISSQVALQTLALASREYPAFNTSQYRNNEVDMAFTVTPVSTSMADPGSAWDLILWSDTSCQYEMYVRSYAKTSSPSDPNRYTDWARIPTPSSVLPAGMAQVVTARKELVGQSLHFNLYDYEVGAIPKLTDLSDQRVYQYAIRFLSVNGQDDPGGWSEEVNFHVSVLEGNPIDLGNLAANINRERYDAAVNAGTLVDIGTPDKLSFTMTKAFLDDSAPVFTGGRPMFTPADNHVDLRLQLSRQGTLFYIIAPADGSVDTRDSTGADVSWRSDWPRIPENGSSVLVDLDGQEVTDENGRTTSIVPFYLTAPSYLEVINPQFDNPEIKTGSLNITAGSVPLTVEGLTPETNYFAYFVIKGTGQTYSQPMLYRFTTTEVQRPVITLDLANPVVNVSADRDSTVDYMVVNYNSTILADLLQRPFWNFGGESGTPSGNKGVVIDEQGTVRGIMENEDEELYDSLRQFQRSYMNIETVEETQPDGTKTTRDVYSNIIVLEAMAQSLARGDSGGEGSVFDKYADEAYKNRVAEYIRAASVTGVGTVIGVGHDVSVSPGNRIVVDTSRFPMSERTQYAFLAVGRSPLGSGDAFRAIYPLTLNDTEAPKVIAVNSTLQMDEEIDMQGVKRILDTCSGTVSLTFNEYLYRQDDMATPPTRYQVDRGPLFNNDRRADYTSVGTLIQSKSSAGVADIVYDNELVNQPTLTVDIKFTYAGKGQYITFNSDLCDRYSNVRNSPLSVRVNIDQQRQVIRLDEQGEPVYELISIPNVEITAAWDARDAK